MASYFIRCSILTNNSLKSMRRFTIQFLLAFNTWSTRYNLSKNGQYSVPSIQWSSVRLNFTVENYRIKLFYDQIDTPHADMSFSKVTITHSIY